MATRTTSKTTITIVIALAALLSPMTAASELIVDSVTKVTKPENAYPCFSPDGKEIVFQSNRTGAWVIFKMNVDGSDPVPLTAEQDYAVTPSWSPDGLRIVYVSAVDGRLEDIWTMNTDGSNKVNVTQSELVNESHPHWTPDASGIIFNSTRDDTLGLDNIHNNEEVYEMAADGSQIKRLTDWPRWDTFASISVDGSSIVWRRVMPRVPGDNEEWNSEVYVMNRDGSKIKNLSHDPGFDGYPVWSPDGSKILFVSARSGNEQIYVINREGSRLQRLIESDQTDARPNWSLDGSKIVFNREEDGTIEILMMHVR